MLSKTFLENLRAYKKALGRGEIEPCECKLVAKDHCKGFKDKIWFGCLKKVNQQDD